MRSSPGSGSLWICRRAAERPWEAKLRFRKLEDFHPEQLLQQLPLLANLSELRSKLLRPASMEAAAKELQEVLKIGSLPAEPPPAAATESPEAMLSRLLGKPPSEASQPTSPAGLAHRLIQQIVGPNVPVVHPQQSHLAALADAELSAGLRAILHHTAFQALEAAWRGIDFLVRSVTEEVELSVINISRKRTRHHAIRAEFGKEQDPSAARENPPRRGARRLHLRSRRVTLFWRELHVWPVVCTPLSWLALVRGWSAAARSRRSRIRTIGRRNPPMNSRNLMRSDGFQKRLTSAFSCRDSSFGSRTGKVVTRLKHFRLKRCPRNPSTNPTCGGIPFFFAPGC